MVVVIQRLVAASARYKGLIDFVKHTATQEYKIVTTRHIALFTLNTFHNSIKQLYKITYYCIFVLVFYNNLLFNNLGYTYSKLQLSGKVGYVLN